MNKSKPHPSTKSTAPQPDFAARPLGHRELPNPLTYSHAYESMGRYAQLLALRHDCGRTCHAYYRQLGLLQRHFGCDPKDLTQDQVREYLLFLKFQKHWKPTTMRQAVACLRIFFHELLKLGPWEVFSQIHLPLIQAAFRDHFRRQLEARGWQVDPSVWTKDWGVHIQEAGNGSHAIRYLGAYVARSVISDQRIVSFDDKTVTFLWKDRADKCFKPKTVSGIQFVERYLRHVLPSGLRSIRYYGYMHPSAVRNRERVRMFTGSPILFGPRPKPVHTGIPTCPSCQKEMICIARLPRVFTTRGPPVWAATPNSR